MCVCSVASVVSNSVTSRTVAHQAPLSMGFSRQEYWGGLPCPLPGESYAGTEHASLRSPALAGGFFTTSTPGKLIQHGEYSKYFIITINGV